MDSRNIIVLFDNIYKLRILKDVLFQIRCNIFHGEKTPSDVHDDRIVATSYPVLS